MLLAVVVFYITYNLTFNFNESYYHGYTFVDWFYMSQTDSVTVLIYTIVLLFGGGFFFTSVLYYFTQIMYRSIGSLALMLFPLFIYSKRLSKFELVDMVIIMLLYLAIMIHNRQMTNDKNTVVIVNKSYVISITAFIALVVLITIAIPKPEIISKQEEDSEYFSAIGKNISLSLHDQITLNSSNDSAKLSDKIIMYVNSKNPMYLRRQSYDYYKNGKWVLDLEFTGKASEPRYWESYVNATTNEEIIKRTNNLIDSTGDTYFTYPEINFKFMDKEKIKITFANGFSPTYMMAPLNTVSVNIKNCVRTIEGHFAILIDRTRYLSGNTENKGYYSLSYYPINNDIYDLASKVSFSYVDLNYLYNLSGEDYDYTDVIKDMNFVKDYVISENSEISNEVANLAMDITKGLDTDFEKARALEGYFTEEDFEYNIDKNNSSVEKFLFDNKSGACADYATAMTLMAKSIGLKARYVEGFVVAEESEKDKNTYVVREYHSHAYVEIYFYGIGWLTFEPTVDGFMDFHKTSTSEDFSLKGLYIALIVIGSVSAICFIIYIFRRQISSGLFLVGVRFYSNDRGVISMYNRIYKKYMHKFKIKNNIYTPRQLEISLSEAGIDSSEFIYEFEKVCYGLGEINKANFKKQFERYKYISKSISKIKVK
ncbi:MAG: transglutaminase domain-containing protein [Clostridiales bacterium]|nr:transglutaminase domain-containing protein [Clostridiales bacterium]